MAKPTLFFDWNGTLFADARHCWRATNATLKLFDRPDISLTTYREKWAMPIAQFYEGLGIDADTLIERKQELYQTWESLYQTLALAGKARRGARAVLSALQDAGYDVAILSNHYVENIAQHARRLNLHAHIATILANDNNDDNFKNNNKSQRLRSYIEARSIEQAMIVGDTEEEIEIAREHKIASIAITDGLCCAKRLRAAQPDYLVKSLGAIPDIAKDFFKGRAP